MRCTFSANIFFFLLAFPAAVLCDSGLLEYEKNSIEIFEKVSPSVVFITGKAVQRDLFSFDVFEIPQGSGSGFVWDEKGHIVTNYHVIQNADNISVTLADGKSYNASVAGVAPSKDLAVLRIQAPPGEIQPVACGSIDDLKVGRKVLAIGNPFGLDQTLTVGTVSALGRQIKSVTGRTIHDMIQTDAAINPGNSGGPLLDSRGLLIGMNTAIITPSGASAGIGFAVPVTIVKSVVPELIAHGRLIRPGLGVQLLSDEIARKYGIEGVAVGIVFPGSAAQHAGIQGLKRGPFGRYIVGDIITKINGKKVTTGDELSFEVERYKVGESIKVEVLRGDKKMSLPLRLQQIE